MRKLVHPIVLRLVYWGVIPLSLLVTVTMYLRIYHRISKMLKFKGSSQQGSVIRALITIIRTRHGDSVAMGKTRSRQMKEIRTTILMFITVFFFVLCWFPGIVALFMLVTMPQYVTSYFRTGVFMLYSLNSALNPFFYAFHISRLRLRLQELWNWVKCKRIQATDEGSTTLPTSKAMQGQMNSKNSKICFNEFDIQF